MIYDVENSVYVENGDIFESASARYIFKEDNCNEDEITIIVFEKPHMKKFSNTKLRIHQVHSLKKNNVVDFIKQFELKFVQNIYKI